MARQYKKNKGRTVALELNDSKNLTGIIEQANETAIKLLVENGKGKLKTTESVEVLIKDIKTAKIQITFK